MEYRRGFGLGLWVAGLYLAINNIIELLNKVISDFVTLAFNSISSQNIFTNEINKLMPSFVIIAMGILLWKLSKKTYMADSHETGNDNFIKYCILTTIVLVESASKIIDLAVNLYYTHSAYNALIGSYATYSMSMEAIAILVELAIGIWLIIKTIKQKNTA